MAVVIKKFKKGKGFIIRKTTTRDTWIFINKGTLKIELPYDKELDNLEDLLFDVMENLEAFLTLKTQVNLNTLEENYHVIKT